MAGTVAGALAACAAVNPEPVPEVRISALVVHNQDSAFIAAVRILVPATGQFVSCSSIAPRARCAVAFPGGTWSGHPIEVTWSAAGNIWSTGEMKLEPGRDAVEAGSAQVHVVIAGPSSAGVSLVADD